MLHTRRRSTSSRPGNSGYGLRVAFIGSFPVQYFLLVSLGSAPSVTEGSFRDVNALDQSSRLTPMTLGLGWLGAFSPRRSNSLPTLLCSGALPFLRSTSGPIILIRPHPFFTGALAASRASLKAWWRLSNNRQLRGHLISSRKQFQIFRAVLSYFPLPLRIFTQDERLIPNSSSIAMRKGRGNCIAPVSAELRLVKH